MWNVSGVARISFPGGSLLMPSKNRYDRELVFEQAEFYARRHGAATLELSRRQMLISAADPQGAQTCASCRDDLIRLTFAIGDRTLCARCARKTAR
jgi:hypothetical protein